MEKKVRYEKIVGTGESDYIKKHSYHFHTKKMPAGEMHSFHWHDYYEFELILNGSVTHTFGNSVSRLLRGSAYLVTPSEYHKIEMNSDSCVFNFRFTGDFFQDKLFNCISSLSRAHCCFGEEDMKYIEERINRIHSLSSSCEFYHELVKSILTEIIIMFMNNHEIKRADSEAPSLVQKSADYVNKNFRTDLTLSGVAEKFSVTPKHLGTVFKKNIGVNFNEYLNCLRLKYACSLLISSDLSVKEIAYASGYNSEQYFLYVFKRYMKTTPSQFRFRK